MTEASPERGIDIDKELKSLEWPYEHPRRGDMPPGHHALSLNEYNIRQPPYAADSKYTKVYSYVQGWSGPDYSKNIVVDEKAHPYTGTNYAWVRARCLGGKTNIWGRLALRLSDYDFKAKTHDGYGDDWPISYSDLSPWYDRVEQFLGVDGSPAGVASIPTVRRIGKPRLMARGYAHPTSLSSAPRGADRLPERPQYPSANRASSDIISGDHGGSKTIFGWTLWTPSMSLMNSRICSVTCGPIGQAGVVSVKVT